jgi:sugar lactone lactonase YvrE
MERPIDLSRRLAACATLVVLPMIAACGGKAGGSAGPAPTGTLAITITTPAGVTGAVSVTGPQSFHQTLSASQTFTRVPVGAYTVTADSVVTPDSVIGSRTDTANFVDASVAVNLNDTGRTSVTYALKQLRGVMVVSNNGTPSFVGTSLYTYGSNRLRSSGAPTPADTIGGLTKPDGMAFDAAGNLWVANELSHKIDMYTPAQLAAGGDPAPARTLTATVDSFATGLRFDASGNLWLMSQQTLQAFTPTQLAAGGTQTGSIKITSSSLVNPVDMLFDGSGNAWVSESFNNQLLKFSASELASSGARTPTVVISAHTGSLNVPAGLAVDGAGNLWVANYAAGTIIAYAPTQLAASGSPTPSITLNLGISTEPWGLAWDRRGGLWYGDFGNHQVGMLSASQLTASGSPTPSVTLTGNLPAYVLFNASMPVPGNGISGAHLRRRPVAAAQAVVARHGGRRVPGLDN